MIAPAPSVEPGPSRDEEASGGGGVTMIVTGSVVFATTWLLTIPITAAASDGSVSGDATDLAAIPIAGPFLVLDEKALTEGGELVYPLVGVLQMAGVGLAIWGAVVSGSGEEVEAAQIAPMFGPGTFGVSARW